VIFQVIEDARLEDEEPAVNPTLSRLRLFGKLQHPNSIQHQTAETRRRAYRGDRGQPAMPAVKLDERGDINITQTISVCRHKGFIADKLYEEQNPPTGHRLRARVDQSNAPVNAVRVDHLARAALQIDEIVTVMRKE